MELEKNDEISTDELEITRNPFESPSFDREHCPGLSPSTFHIGRTPGSETSSKFRWSIDQIANLVPAEIDEFPMQEYSRSLEGHEETALQEKLNEFFTNATMPSPWILSKPTCAKKTVTFSPHPPATMYIDPEGPPESDISMTSSSVDGKSCTVGCQTALSIPMDFDFDKLLAHTSMMWSSTAIKSDKDEISCNKELSISSLRRKLFDHDEMSDDDKRSNDEDDDGDDHENSHSKSAIQRPSSSGSVSSPRIPNLVTSSPLKDLDYYSSPDGSSPGNCSIRHTSFDRNSGISPDISPIKTPIGCRQLFSSNSNDSSDFYVSSISMASQSKMQSIETKNETSKNGIDNEKCEMSGVDTSVKESTHAPLPMFACDTLEAAVSPISYSRSGKLPRQRLGRMAQKIYDESCVEFNNSMAGCNSIKESTAHVLPSLDRPDLSPISNACSTYMISPKSKLNDHSNNKRLSDCQEDDHCDGGPMNITELHPTSNQSGDKSNSILKTEGDSSSAENEVFLPVSPLSTKMKKDSVGRKTDPKHVAKSLPFNNMISVHCKVRTPLGDIKTRIDAYGNITRQHQLVADKSKCDSIVDNRDVIHEANAALARADLIQERLVKDGIKLSYEERPIYCKENSRHTMNDCLQWRSYRRSFENIDSGVGSSVDASEHYDICSERQEQPSINTKGHCHHGKESTASPTLNFSGLCLSSPNLINLTPEGSRYNRIPVFKRQASPRDVVKSLAFMRSLSPSSKAPPPKIPRSLPSPLH